MGFIPKHCIINISCLVGMKNETDERIREEFIKREKARILIKGIANTRNWPERPRRVESTLGET